MGRSADPLSRWLAGEGLATLDAVSAEAPDVIGIMDRELTIRYVNWTAPGLRREDVIGHSVFNVVPPDFHEVSRRTYLEALRTGAPARFETIYKDGDNVLVWDVHVGPIRFEGEVIGLIVFTSEVTEQRRVHVDRDRFFSLSLDLLVVASPDGRLKRVNPALGETLGYATDELIGTPFIDLIHPDDKARTRESFQRVRDHRAIPDFENRYRHRNGEYRVFSWRSTVDPVTGDVYSVARDITRQRATETQLRHAQKMEAVGQLAGGVAHDFNNLLAAILGNAELAMRAPTLSPEIAEHLSEIREAAERAADLTKQLLAYSRRQLLRPILVDLNDLIQRLVKMLRRLLPESIAIELIPGHNLATVAADPSQLEQVIVNLCVNARDAMERGGRLTIETENVLINSTYREAHPWAEVGRYVLLTVTDTGVGMPAEVRERIFEPFFTTKAQGGTGLGLSTVYGIVEQHGGRVHVYSEVGVGTTFKVYLPADTREATTVGDKIHALPQRGHETILIAEDEAQVRRVLVKILESAGYRTIVATNGHEAIRLLREQTDVVHLALLDVVMPGLGGPETWEQMRGTHEGLRVMFATGYADDHYRTRLPPDADVIEKPFHPEELLTRIRKTLDR